ncbi:hypothetical protein [Salibacterium halotolerans]|uniref:Uncharacterized protein n=1 Tax=Salibacterium halotolerans TaxID=1884432 RepID=A0A1I5XLT2_9BACI|nr:hypothetical protein [Salibacterium halotolerans]SFQ32904.1 hypothetical protein SAMN05518683_12928 [Salibacterium halotolerans]
MRTFFKLNILSLLYGCMTAVPCLLLYNTYRINDLIGLNTGTQEILFIIVTLIVYILGAVSGIYLTAKWLKNRVINMWAVLLWFPYCLVILRTFGWIFPITNEGFEPGPGGGFILIGIFAFSSIFLLFINIFCIGKRVVEE